MRVYMSQRRRERGRKDGVCVPACALDEYKQHSTRNTNGKKSTKTDRRTDRGEQET